MKHYLIQYRFFRKILGGTFYLIYPIQLNIKPFWSDYIILSCQSKLLACECYNKD